MIRDASISLAVIIGAARCSSGCPQFSPTDLGKILDMLVELLTLKPISISLSA